MMICCEQRSARCRARAKIRREARKVKMRVQHSYDACSCSRSQLGYLSISLERVGGREIEVKHVA